MMQSGKSPPTAPSRQNVRLSWLSEGLLEIMFQGRLDAEALEATVKQLAAMTEHTRLDSVLIDGLEVDGYTSHVGSPAGRVILLARQRGVREVVFVIGSDANRMIAASVAFASQVPLKVFPTRGEALAYLRV
ncbi:hypothetical protein [Chondromyces crocatus]|nr:hypothetical protein [Chondromyces crocatus]